MGTKYRPILHVHVIDDLTGKLLADVDAPTTANALAYYLWSRRIDEDATEASVVTALAAGMPRGQNRTNLGGPEPVVYEQRDPISHALDFALSVHVEGDQPLCDGCQRAALAG